MLRLTPHPPCDRKPFSRQRDAARGVSRYLGHGAGPTLCPADSRGPRRASGECSRESWARGGLTLGRCGKGCRAQVALSAIRLRLLDRGDSHSFDSEGARSRSDVPETGVDRHRSITRRMAVDSASLRHGSGRSSEPRSAGQTRRPGPSADRGPTEDDAPHDDYPPEHLDEGDVLAQQDDREQNG